MTWTTQKKTHIGTAVQWQRHTHRHEPSAYNLYRVGMEEKKLKQKINKHLKKLQYTALKSINYFPLARHFFFYSHSRCGGVRPSAIEVKFAQVSLTLKRSPPVADCLLLLCWKQLTRQTMQFAGRPSTKARLHLLALVSRCIWILSPSPFPFSLRKYEWKGMPPFKSVRMGWQATSS